MYRSIDPSFILFFGAAVSSPSREPHCRAEKQRDLCPGRTGVPPVENVSQATAETSVAARRWLPLPTNHHHKHSNTQHPNRRSQIKNDHIPVHPWLPGAPSSSTSNYYPLSPNRKWQISSCPSRLSALFIHLAGLSDEGLQYRV